jgi:hypothetical protein
MTGSFGGYLEQMEVEESRFGVLNKAGMVEIKMRGCSIFPGSRNCPCGGMGWVKWTFRGGERAF